MQHAAPRRDGRLYLQTPAHRFLRLHASMSLIVPRVPHRTLRSRSLSLFLSLDWYAKLTKRARHGALRRAVRSLCIVTSCSKGVMARQRYLHRCVYLRHVAVNVAVASVSFSEAPPNRWIDSPVYFIFRNCSFYSPASSLSSDSSVSSLGIWSKTAGETIYVSRVLAVRLCNVMHYSNINMILIRRIKEMKIVICEGCMQLIVHVI